MEEIPARFVRGAINQFHEKLDAWLNESRIHFSSSKIYATPRRIAVMFHDVSDRQEDTSEEVKGPSRKIAEDENGSWTKAALGFAKSQGVNEEALFYKTIKDVEYVHAVKNTEGVDTFELLSKHLKDMILSLQFPKNMRWGNYNIKFIRPIRWMTAMYGEQVIPFEIAGTTTSNSSKGHRFLGHDIELRDVNEYAEKLEQQFVIADIEKRKHMIVEQIKQLEADNDWHIPIDESLLEEVLFLVEYPTALAGQFEEEFLTIPKEVLITSMREHQRYFPVLNKEGELLPFFVTVRNGNEDGIEQVAKGNAKVLRARLADARFFYEEDQKMSIDSAIARLEKIVFHDELGTIGDKVRRMKHIAESLSTHLQLDEPTTEQVKRATCICKFDLVSQMVGEFPELQGTMGKDYALKAGEDQVVADAIFEHYQPRFAGDATPKSIVGAVLSLADKVDTLVGCFSIGIIPTGSQDPYALRRQAAGIVQILKDAKLDLSISALLQIAVEAHNRANLLKKEANKLQSELTQFIALRVKNTLMDIARYDIVDAVMESGFDYIELTMSKTNTLKHFITEEVKPTVEAFNRVSNLAEKADSDQINVQLLEEGPEAQLHQMLMDVESKMEEALQQKQIEKALQYLTELEQPITTFFDHVMVMVDDEALRVNRLALLHRVGALIHSFADFKKIVW